MMNDDGYPCPCCGHKTIGLLGDYEIYPICDWEDDPYQSEYPDYSGGANKLSLNQARLVYQDKLR